MNSQSTHAVGKWHLGFRTPKHTPTERGFDTYYGYYAGSQDYFNHQSLCWAGKVLNGCFENTTASGAPVTGLDLHNGTKVANSSEYSTTLYTTEAARILAAHAAAHALGPADSAGRVTMAKPLFLYLPHQAVHVGNIPEPSHPEYALDQAPPQYIEPFLHIEDEARRNLSAMVYAMDEACGNITDALKQYGFWQDTIFVMSVSNAFRPFQSSAGISPCAKNADRQRWSHRPTCLELSSKWRKRNVVARRCPRGWFHSWW